MALVANKISRNLGVMYRIKNLVSNHIIKLLYFTMIELFLSYCSIVWGGANCTTLHRFTILQKHSMTLINRADYLAHTRPLIYTSEILNMPDLHFKLTVLFMFKSILKMLPQCCSNYLVEWRPVSRYNIHKNSLHCMIEYNRTCTRDKFVSCNGPKLWNTLPDYILSSENVPIFASRVKEFLLSHCISVIEM